MRTVSVTLSHLVKIYFWAHDDAMKTKHFFVALKEMKGGDLTMGELALRMGVSVRQARRIVGELDHLGYKVEQREAKRKPRRGRPMMLWSVRRVPSSLAASVAGGGDVV